MAGALAERQHELQSLRAAKDGSDARVEELKQELAIVR